MDTNMKPKVSIQMCTYNRAHFIKQAIQSVLSQTFSNWELLIIDDASTDNTKEVVASCPPDTRIKYVENESNLGITKNRNKCLNLSQGEYIAVLDSDDYWLDRTKLEKQVEFLDKNPSYALVGTNMQIVDENNNIIRRAFYQRDDALIKSGILTKNQFCHSSVLYRKKIVKELGGYDESLVIWEDYDLWLRIGINSKFDNLSLISTAYRKHENQSDSKKRKESLKFLSEIIEKYKDDYPNYFIARLVQFLRILRG